MDGMQRLIQLCAIGDIGVVFKTLTIFLLPEYLIQYHCSRAVSEFDAGQS